MPTTPETVLELVAAQLGAKAVRPQDRIVEDLGAESMDIVNIMAAVEERYAVHIDEAELPAIRTIEGLAALVARLTASSPAP